MRHLLRVEDEEAAQVLRNNASDLLISILRLLNQKRDQLSDESFQALRVVKNNLSDCVQE